MRGQPFDQIEYQRVDYEFVANEMRKARLKLRIAVSTDQAEHALMDMQSALRIYRTQSSVARIRHDRKTSDKFYSAEQDYYDQADARIELLLRGFYQTLLASRHHESLVGRVGELLFRKAENIKDIVQSAVVEDLAEENHLSSVYLQIISEAKIVFEDRQYALSELGPLLESQDRLTRIRAHRQLSNWYANHGENLDDLFDLLVQVRHRMAGKMGFASFTPIGYKRMERFDYSREDIEALRESVLRYIVPLTQEIRRLQRRRLSLDKLYHFDLPCLFPNGNPKPIVTDSILPRVMSDCLSAVCGTEPSSFKKLVDGGYIDLEARPDKAPGGYCQTILNAGLPFILMNGTGTAGDVMTLLHEAGHAYASLKSLESPTLIEYTSPSLDACEIHSTAMEYLAYPEMERFFGEMAEDVRLMHMTQSLLFIPYGCLVDEFMHVVADHPDMTAKERHQTWRRLEKKYQPDLDYDDAPYFERGGAWQMKEHIFTSPFYYIDYVLAQLTALDIWRLSQRDRAEAFRRYDHLCSLGGRHTFSELLELSGLASPFAPSTIKTVAYAASNYLDL